MCMTFGKRQLVIASLVVALGAAVYLNWQFSDAENIVANESEVSSSKQLGQTTYVNTELSSTVSTEKKSETSKEVSEKESDQTSNKTKTVNTEVSEGHFAAEKAKRDKSNEKTLESLADVMESTEDSNNKDAASSAEKIASNIKVQTDIENEIITRGFEDALVIINNDNCSVSVFGGNLDDASAIVIKDIVNRQAGIDFDKITVSGSKK